MLTAADPQGLARLLQCFAVRCRFYNNTRNDSRKNNACNRELKIIGQGRLFITLDGSFVFSSTSHASVDFSTKDNISDKS